MSIIAARVSRAVASFELGSTSLPIKAELEEDLRIDDVTPEDFARAVLPQANVERVG